MSIQKPQPGGSEPSSERARTPLEPDDDALSEAEMAQLDATPAVSTLLKRSLAKNAAFEPAPNADERLLASVQETLRKRSRGKFYGDGWSTTPSRVSYAWIAGVMLVTIAAVWLALGPTGFTLR